MRSEQVAKVASRRYWREGDARVIIEAWRHAGGPLSRLAERHGFDPQRLARWAARLKKAEPGPLRFHPVRLTRMDGRGMGAAERRGAL